MANRTEDRLVNSASSEMIAKLVPNAKLVGVLGGGHAFFMEMHKDFNSEVLHFLKDA
jgi:pimeloyl-ACP methyl ester carboxylesterase